MGKKKNKLENIHALCRSCAIECGGVWPKIHIAASWIDQCELCGETTSVVSRSDYEWPEKKYEKEREM